MIDVKIAVDVASDFKELVKLESAMTRENAIAAAAAVRRTAQASMKAGKGASRPGTPPNLHEGKLRKSILFAVEPDNSAFIGPSWNALKNGGRKPFVGAIHEFGKTIKRKAKRKGGKTSAVYPARPFMRPALEKVNPSFAASYAGSFGK